MVFHAGARTYARDPDVEEARFTQANDRSEGVEGEGDQQNPPGAEDEEELNCNYDVDDEERVGHACEHLRASESLETFGRVYVI